MHATADQITQKPQANRIHRQEALLLAVLAPYSEGRKVVE
jgi:hypothetical protein